MDPNWNNATHHSARLAVVKKHIDAFGFPIQSITPINYEPSHSHPYPNFLFLVTLTTPMCAPLWTGLYPGTSQWSKPSGKVLFRFSNRHPDTGFNLDTRVGNEIAAMSIARDALRSAGLATVVPEVWAWKGVPGYWGEHPSTAMQVIDGEPLDEVFPTLADDEKNEAMRQIAQIVAAIQSVKLPETLKGFGGMGFDGEECGSAVVAGPIARFKAGPFETFAEMTKGMMRCKLEEADKHKILQGCRARLQALVDVGIDNLLEGIDTSQRCLAHGDFTMKNMLYSKASGKLTGLIDFDYSSISHAATDLFTSDPSYARLPNRYTADEEQLTLRDALLNGFPEPLPANTESVDWDTAKQWDEQMAAAGCVRAESMDEKELDVLSWLYEVLELLSPDNLTNPTTLRLRANQKGDIEREKEEAEELIEKALEDWAEGKIGG
ncbi:hypothetical protein BDV96DRAFT_492145 [Lophiotrema nucula]|uniref:Aminoglycoside phosphotransferase domain-containing protein n=1 Tax=Lophiotrema nucula TaxID=690887 RepID=A0A6A5Z7X6_9PLEO|nr:hypothetical protein BDV96DRAFT_492145 [Lophiotrema nucula]